MGAWQGATLLFIVYIVICIESLKQGFVIFERIFAIVKLYIEKVGRELLRKCNQSKKTIDSA